MSLRVRVGMGWEGLCRGAGVGMRVTMCYVLEWVEAGVGMLVFYELGLCCLL